MSKPKDYSIIEAATLLRCSVYDVRRMIVAGTVKAHKRGDKYRSPWIVLLNKEQIQAVKPERIGPSGKTEAEVQEAPGERAKDSGKRRTGYTPVEWFAD